MADLRIEGRSAWARDVHIHGVTVGSREFGPVAVRALAHVVMELLDVDKILVAGARRTSGANPGRRSRAFWVARAAEAEAADDGA